MGVEDGKLGDVPDGAVPGKGDNSGDVNDFGLTADEAKAWAEMEQSDRTPRGEVEDAPPPGDNSGDDDAALKEFLDKPLRVPGEKKPPVLDLGDDDEDDDGPPRADADGEDDLPPENPQQQTVSYGKHRREMKKLADKLKAAKAAPGNSEELQAERVKTARLEERLGLVLDAINAKRAPKEEEKVEEDPEPDEVEKPFEHASWTRRELKRTQEQMAALAERVNKGETTREAESEEATLANNYVAACREYAAGDETFPYAYEVMKRGRFVQIALSRFNKDIESDDPADKLTPQETNAVVSQFRKEEQNIASAELKAGRNPAHKIVRFAKTYGFNPEEVKKAIAEHNAGKKPNGNGKAAEGEKPKVSDEVRKLRERREASKSLSDGGAAPGGDQLTVRRVADMPQDEFNKLIDGLSTDEIETMILGKG